jgi:hypothetical protein
MKKSNNNKQCFILKKLHCSLAFDLAIGWAHICFVHLSSRSFQSRPLGTDPVKRAHILRLSFGIGIVTHTNPPSVRLVVVAEVVAVVVVVVVAVARHRQMTSPIM